MGGRKCALTIGVVSVVLDLSVEELSLGYRVYRLSPWSWARPDLLFSENNPYVWGHDATLVAAFSLAAAALLLALFSGTSRRALTDTRAA